jgi:hypothetical protein
LSNETGTRAVVDDESPIVTFKSTYPDLFERLEATFGLYPSNSRLAKIIHGGMRANLHSGTGMDEVDAQHNYNLGTEYNFRRKHRNVTTQDNPPAKRFKSADHQVCDYVLDHGLNVQKGFEQATGGDGDPNNQ